MLTIEEARTRVARGAAHLDVVRPGWHERIDTGTLTLHDPCGCIVGQLCGSDANRFSMDAEALGLTGGAFGTAVLYGFDLNMKDSEFFARSSEAFRIVQDAWIEAIADRNLAASAKLIETTHPAPVPVQA